MNDMSQTIIPKSDQINADDLLPGPMTITITGVSIKTGADQPVSISFAESKKVYRPGKSMARVMVSAWGVDANEYTGRKLTLYCDPKVSWGGMPVGGIRISHMSHIESDLTILLTATRGNKKPFHVKQLAAAPVRTEAERLASAQMWVDGFKERVAKCDSEEAIYELEAEKEVDTYRKRLFKAFESLATECNDAVTAKRESLRGNDGAV